MGHKIIKQVGFLIMLVTAVYAAGAADPRNVYRRLWARRVPVADGWNLPTPLFYFDGSWTNAQGYLPDASGNNNLGKLGSGVRAMTYLGKTGYTIPNAVGANGPITFVRTNIPMNVSELTLAGWYCPTGTQANGTLMGYLAGGTNAGWVRATTLRWYGGGAAVQSGAISLSTDTWTHVIGIWSNRGDGAVDLAQIWTNGVLASHVTNFNGANNTTGGTWQLPTPNSFMGVCTKLIGFTNALSGEQATNLYLK